MKNAPALILIGLTVVVSSVRADDDKWDIKKMDLSKVPPASDTKDVTYAKDIRPILEVSCFRCHGEEKQKGDLRMDTREAVLKGGEDGKVVIPGNSKMSLLVAAAAQVNDEVAMPPKRKPGGPGGRPPGGPGGPGGAGDPGGPDRPPRAAGGGQGPGGPGGRGPGGPPAKPLTPEQVGLVRAWIDQGAK